jgi:Ca2+-binding RTX toxin-like protein
LSIEWIVPRIKPSREGTEEGDHMYGTDAGEEINAYGGDDQGNAFSGDDTVYGDEGNDTLYGGDWDTVWGTSETTSSLEQLG